MDMKKIEQKVMVIAAVVFLAATIIMDKGFISVLAWYLTLFLAVAVLTYHVVGLFKNKKP